MDTRKGRYRSVMSIATSTLMVCCFAAKNYTVKSTPGGGTLYEYKNGLACERGPYYNEDVSGKAAIKVIELINIEGAYEKKQEKARNVSITQEELDAGFFRICMDYGQGTITKEMYQTSYASYDLMHREMIRIISNPIIKEFCLSASSFYKIKVKAGQHVTIEATINERCSKNGWSCRQGGGFSGPEGESGQIAQNALSAVHSVNMLLGSYSATEAGSVQDTWKAMKSAGVFAVGSNFSGPVPSDGNLYLIFNDLLGSEVDNQGAVNIRITIR